MLKSISIYSQYQDKIWQTCKCRIPMQIIFWRRLMFRVVVIINFKIKLGSSELASHTQNVHGAIVFINFKIECVSPRKYVQPQEATNRR